MVELRMRHREMRQYKGKRHENLRCKRIMCTSHFTIHNTAGPSSVRACNYAKTRSSQHNRAYHALDFWYPHVLSTSLSSSSPMSLIVVHNSTIISEHKGKSFLSLSPRHDLELSTSTAWTGYSIQWVQRTSSTAYTEYAIHPQLFVPPSFSWLGVDPWM